MVFKGEGSGEMGEKKEAQTQKETQLSNSYKLQSCDKYEQWEICTWGKGEESA